MAKSLVEEAFNLVKVARDPYSGLYSLEMPGRRAIQSMFNDLHIRAPVPDDSDPFWSELSAMVSARMATLRSIADKLYPLHDSSQMASTFSAPAPSLSQDEAEVKQMKGSEALAAASRLGLRVNPHPTNPGISAMRAKNALYAAFRKGQSLREHSPTRSRNPWPGARSMDKKSA